MAKTEYRIISNQPDNGAYGQYSWLYDPDEFWDITGLNTIGSTDDLYTLVDNRLTAPVNSFTPFESFNGASADWEVNPPRLEFEVAQLYLADFNNVGFIRDDYYGGMYIFDGIVYQCLYF